MKCSMEDCENDAIVVVEERWPACQHHVNKAIEVVLTVKPYVHVALVVTS